MKKILIALALVFGVTLAAPTVSVSAAEGDPTSTSAAKESICEGVGLTGGDCNDTAGPSLDQTIKTVIRVLSWIVGVTAIIVIIIGGMKYITSAGDANSISSAKKTILYAIIGLVIVLLAQVIVRFVLDTAGTKPA